jgi:murein DD-endopeptidase MepM/ murein hydrolase activator NlpD
VLTRRRVRRWALVVTAALLSSLAVPATAADSPGERRIAASRAKLARVRAELEEARSRHTEQVAALQSAQQHLATVMEAVASAELAVVRQQDAVEQARTELDALVARADQRRRVMAARAKVVYKRGTNGTITALLESTNPQDALRRSVYTDAIDRSDQRLIERTAAAQKAVDIKRSEFQAQEATLQRVLVEQRALLAEVRKVQSDRAMTVAMSNAHITQLEAEEEHLEAEEREITAIARRSVPPTLSSHIPLLPGPGLVGSWVWPARGPITSGFGLRWGRMHEGIDIGALIGAPIVAAKAGTVVYASTMRGYGNVVMILHGGGLTTVYAHQSAILVRFGQPVVQGQQIGRVGCSGHCNGPHLHFEIRFNGTPRNPRSYL